ncbi:DUF3769 domain-containing protein [Synechococcus sp. FGCU-3]|nr:DUF3769 domain-containing protein [Synechococcus sp. FGCU3]
MEIGLSANEQSYDAQLGRVVANGNAAATLAGGRIRADRIEYDLNSRTVYAIGAVRFQRGQQYLQASKLRYSLLEGAGEIEDVYGVIDLDTSAQDLDIEQRPSQPLGPTPPMACTPKIPELPNWHPYPWAATAWAGQMVNANFGETFLFQGSWRPEYLTGVNIQRRLLDGGPFTLETDVNLMGHIARAQQGGPFNQPVPNAPVPAQSFGEGTLGLGLRLWLRPWLNIFVVEGVSLNTDFSYYEQTYRERFSKFLNYLAFEVEALVDPQWSVVGRIHHRSGAYGTYNGVSEGSNGYLLGVRYRWGDQKAPNRVIAAMPPALGCPGTTPDNLQQPRTLNEQLDAVATGKPGVSATNPTAASAPTSKIGAAAEPQTKSKPQGNAWERARQEELARRQVTDSLNQRVSDVRFERTLKAERRFGFPSQLTAPDTVNQYGAVRPAQLQSLTTAGNAELVKGTVSRWRFQAKRMTFTPGSLQADRAAFTNDPFTPAQSWLNSEGVVATLQPNGDTVIKAKRNRLILDERLPIPVTRQTRIEKKEEVDNRVVLGQDNTDRGGFFVGYKLTPIRFGDSGSLELQPQFLVQRAINGYTSSYPLPGQSAGDPPSSQPNAAGDLFGMVARLRTPIAGFRSDANLEISTFNPSNIANGTRSWGDMARSVRLPLLGDSTLRLFGAYRYRTWNGSLGEQDVYSAYGVSLDDSGNLPNWGSFTSNYFWRIGVGNYQGNDFDTTNLIDLWRGNLIASVNGSLPLWTGKPLDSTPLQALAYSPRPIVPGLRLNANVTTELAYFGNGTNQNTLTLSGGPTLTLGHFSKPFFDYTELTVTGSGTLRQGLSQFSFDRAVDLGTINVGLTQQLAGPLLFSGGVGYNVDPNSGFYGSVTNSYVELRWQRRSYDIGVYYSPYEGLGGIRVRLNDFNFKGTGTPFVPYSGKPGPQRRLF